MTRESPYIYGDSSLTEIAKKWGCPVITVQHTLTGALDKILVGLLRKYTIEEVYDALLSYRDRNTTPEALYE